MKKLQIPVFSKILFNGKKCLKGDVIKCKAHKKLKQASEF